MQALYDREEFGNADWLKVLQSRWQMLIVVSFAHLLLFMLWPSITLHKSENAAPVAFWLKMLDMPAQIKPAPVAPTLKQSMPVRQLPVMNKALAPASGNTDAAPVPSAIPEPAPEATVPAAIENPVGIQRDIRKISKDVEREMPNRILTDIRPEKSSMLAFEKNVSAAARSRGTTLQNFVLSDGTAMTKVTTSLGSYCVIGAKPGWDITKTPGIRTVSCGSY